MTILDFRYCFVKNSQFNNWTHDRFATNCVTCWFEFEIHVFCLLSQKMYDILSKNSQMITVLNKTLDFDNQIESCSLYIREAKNHMIFRRLLNTNFYILSFRRMVVEYKAELSLLHICFDISFMLWYFMSHEANLKFFMRQGWTRTIICVNAIQSIHYRPLTKHISVDYWQAFDEALLHFWKFNTPFRNVLA